MLLVRHGRVVNVRTFGLKEVRLPDDELIASFVTEYYRRGSYVPHEVLLPMPIEAGLGLAELLSDQRGSKTELLFPQRGKKTKLLHMATENAAHAFRENARAGEDTPRGFCRSRSGSSCPRARTHRVHRFSHLGGTERSPRSSRSRRARPTGGATAASTCATCRAATTTARCTRCCAPLPALGEDSGWELPDLLVVDGGKGQLAIASGRSKRSASRPAGAALAKEKAERARRAARRPRVPARAARTRSSCARAARRCKSWRTRATRRTGCRTRCGSSSARDASCRAASMRSRAWARRRARCC